jgi:hypothetical protein
MLAQWEENGRPIAKRHAEEIIALFMEAGRDPLVEVRRLLSLPLGITDVEVGDVVLIEAARLLRSSRATLEATGFGVPMEFTERLTATALWEAAGLASWRSTGNDRPGGS